MTLDAADRYAAELIAAIAPFCVPDRCMVVGSVRRRVPNPDTIAKDKFPARRTVLKGPHCKFEIHWPSRETYGLTVFTNTGPDSYVARAMQFWHKITNGRIGIGSYLTLPDNSVVPTLTEQAVFEAFDHHAKLYAEQNHANYVPVKFIAPGRRC